jgi:superfamily II DNA or RNA helicase
MAVKAKNPSSNDRLLAERYATLDDIEQSLIETLCLGDGEITLASLTECLNSVAPHLSWQMASTQRVRTALEQLSGFAVIGDTSGVVGQGGELLRAAVFRGVLASGRITAWKRAFQKPRPRLAGYENIAEKPAIEQRLRVAALLCGLDPYQHGLVTIQSLYHHIESPMTVVCAAAHDPVVLGALNPKTRAFAVATQLLKQLWAPTAELSWWMEQARSLRGASDRSDAPLLDVLVRHLIRRGDIEAVAAIMGASEVNGQLITGYRAALRGDGHANVFQALEQALKALRREHGQRIMLGDFFLKLYLACLSAGDTPEIRKRREQFIKVDPREGAPSDAYTMIWWQEFMQARSTGRAMKIPKLPEELRADDCWWLAVLLSWSKVPINAELRAALARSLEQSVTAGWQLLAAQLNQIVKSENPQIRPALLNVLDWCRSQDAWESALEAIAELARGASVPKSAAAGKFSRIEVRLRRISERDEFLDLMLFEQRPQAKGFSAGRQLISARTVLDATERMAPDDTANRRLLQAVIADAGREGYVDELRRADSRTVQALIGHPRVVDAADTSKLYRVEAGQVQLLAQKRIDETVDLKFSVAIPADRQGMVAFEDERLIVYQFDATTQALARILHDGLLLPAEAVAPLLDLLPDLSQRIRVATDLASFGVSEVEADTQAYALLEPLGDGLRLRLMVRPLGAGTLAQPLGTGPETVIATRNGQPVRAQRDLASEREVARQLRALCPSLEAAEFSDKIEVRDPEAALVLIEELQGVGALLVLEWPVGKALRVGRPRDANALTIKVKSQRDWFSAEGGIALDDGSVVALSEIMKQLASTQGRFLRLDSERVIALEGELRRRLEMLRGFADDSGKLTVTAVAAPIFAEALDDQSDIDIKFRDQLGRIDRAQNLVAAIPADFQAELRDYQVDGFRFLMRLAGWGAGACLADDMGLGKTVQALAMLSARAAEGPALVLAPTSVVGNWRREAMRFAPALNVRIYGEGDREQALSDLAPGDLIVVSYGLLVAQIEQFEKIRFATLVLDEAQAIKNSATQRAQAVRRLQADFRVATTGTPLENHLGELWSLFRVLNPGLLGSEEQFRKRFVNAMERDPRAPEREHLRRLLAPFLLRRTKAEVLTELPPRTEILLTVEPSVAEAQLLAAVKRQSLEHLNNQSLPPEQRRVQVLAEIMRLRRAACHPDLVAPELQITSAKLEQLVELVQELTDNRHRALVFSQFVDYLTLVRERLDKEGIDYQYLDGSTSQKNRDAAVAAFQRGEGKVFLLSLKAGGVGINLTAADYVIHLDPWWNPAVEQQASDRAHRIGQTRPVTIYKLVLKGSIEEQVIALHASKRELIDQVIEGQTSAAKMSVDELLALLADS